MKKESISQHNPLIEENHTAKIVIDYLDTSAQQLDKQTTGKLDQAREHAVSAFAKRKQTATHTNGAHVLSLLGDYFHHHRSSMSAALILGTVLIALFLSQQFTAQNTSEQGDAFLLASDLPPEAYLDKGFDVWLARN